MKKTNSYFFTKAIIAILFVLGLFLAMFPGMYAKYNINIDGNEIVVGTFVGAYTSMFGGKFTSNLVLDSSSISFQNDPKVIELLKETIDLNIKANPLVITFFVLSIISIILFILYGKSRIVSLIVTIILIITTVTFATSNLTFNMTSSSELFLNPTYEVSLGMLFLTLTYGIICFILMFHLFRILIKPNSLELKTTQNLQD